MLKVDLNSDLGEGYGAYATGDDAQMLIIVTSANVACGFHAGDPEIMAHTFRIARENGVSVGAHPGFPGLWGFTAHHLAAVSVERVIHDGFGGDDRVVISLRSLLKTCRHSWCGRFGLVSASKLGNMT